MVDGCKDGSNEPGALEFDWLEVQLDSFRERGMQVSSSCCRVMIVLMLMYRTRWNPGLVDGSCATQDGAVL